MAMVFLRSPMCGLENTKNLGRISTSIAYVWHLLPQEVAAKSKVNCTAKGGGGGRDLFRTYIESRKEKKQSAHVSCMVSVAVLTRYRGTSLVRNTHPPRITIGP